MSGVILGKKEIFMGAVDAIEDYLENGAILSEDVNKR
jgi:hypothetical protein